MSRSPHPDSDPTDHDNKHPGACKDTKRFFPVNRENFFCGLDDPGPVEKEVNCQQYQQENGKIQMNISPFVTVKSEEVPASSFWYDKTQ